MTDTLTRELAALDDALAGRPVDPDLAALAELAVALRDDRPAPAPAFTGSLDERAERGFPAPAGARRRRRGVKWPRLTLPALGLAATAAIVVVVALGSLRGEITPPSKESPESVPSAASGGGRSVARAKPAPSGGDTAARAKRAPSAASGSDSAGASAPATSAPGAALAPLPSSPPADRASRRSVERAAELVLATPPRGIDRAAAEILRVTDDLGGYVVSSTVSSGASGQFELRVPESRLQTALARLSRVAKVRERTQSAHDITGAVVSARERLNDARTERRSLLRQLAKATTPNQTASIRARLRLVSGQIAAGKRDLARVRTRATRSTIAVTLVADRSAAAAASDDDGWTPRDALDLAVQILEFLAGAALVAVAILLPLGLVALLARLAARQATRRRRERALDAV
jgi:uncharacterized protein DUF4349